MTMLFFAFEMGERALMNLGDAGESPDICGIYLHDPAKLAGFEQQ